MIERWRCFVAVPLPQELRADLTNFVDAWRGDSQGPDLRWTDPAGWHVTLAFLGWIEAGLSQEILERLVRPARDRQRVEMAAGGLGAFPSARRARVLWYGLTDAGGAAASLAEGIGRALAPTVPRVDDGSPFRPHLTLARARAERGVDLASWMAGRAVPSGVVPLERVILYRSHLGRGPAHYEALGEVTVGTGAHIVRNVEAEASVHG
jgi:2'-5' RNA ligase